MDGDHYSSRPTGALSSIALLQERFRQLEKYKEMRLENQLSHHRLRARSPNYTVPANTNASQPFYTVSCHHDSPAPVVSDQIPSRYPSLNMSFGSRGSEVEDSPGSFTGGLVIPEAVSSTRPSPNSHYGKLSSSSHETALTNNCRHLYGNGVCGSNPACKSSLYVAGSHYVPQMWVSADCNRNGLIRSGHDSTCSSTDLGACRANSTGAHGDHDADLDTSLHL